MFDERINVLTCLCSQGLSYLTACNIIHRDISAGNIYIWDTEANRTKPDEGMEGFIADLELAYVQPPHSEPEYKRVRVSPLGSSPSQAVPAAGVARMPGPWKNPPTPIPMPGAPVPPPSSMKRVFTGNDIPSSVPVSAGPEMTVGCFNAYH